MTDDAHLILPDAPAFLAGRLAGGGAVAWSERSPNKARAGWFVVPADTTSDAP